MTRKQQRIYAVLLVLAGAVMAAGLTLFALRDTVTFFYTPSDIVGDDVRFIAPARPFRLGGLVVYGTVERQGKTVKFTVTDNLNDIPVTYDGIPPNLFHEGQGIVATGQMNDEGVFVATQLLAKHDENYMPPEVAKALKPRMDTDEHK